MRPSRSFSSPVRLYSSQSCWLSSARVTSERVSAVLHAAHSAGPCATSVPMRRPTFVLVCCGAALLAAGCGSSKQLCKGEFQAKANHICSDLRRREKPDVSSTSRAALDRNISRLDSALSDLNGLHPP